MRRTSLLLAATALVGTLGGTLSVQAQSAADATTIFLVDESGSMAGEHNFLQNFVLDLDAALSVSGLATRQYGLTGFGGPGQGAAGLRSFGIGGKQLLGSANDFTDAAQNLVTSGITEDGYAAIDHVLNNYTLPASGVTFVLVTDEDRDNTNGALTFQSILTALQNAGVGLVSMLDVSIRDDNANPAISTDGTTALVQNGQSFTSQPLGGITSNEGTTIADYSDLTLAVGGGCVADLNQLRAGGDAATAFAAAFQTCIVNAATNNNITQILVSGVRDTGLAASRSLRAQLRSVALSMGWDGGGGAGAEGGSARRIAAKTHIAENAMGVEGLRGYILLGYESGNVDANGRNIAQDHRTTSITAGGDMTMPVDAKGGTLRVGAALSFGDTASLSATGRTDTDQRVAQVYAVYRMANGWQFAGDVQVGAMDHQITRYALPANFTGNTDADLMSVSLEAGQRIEVASGLILMPYGGLDHTRYDVDGYTEAPGGLVVAGFEESVTTARLGLRVENIDLFQSATVSTAIDVSLAHTLDSSVVARGAGAAPVLDPVDETRLDLALEFGVALDHGGDLFVQFAGSAGEHSNSGSVGLGYQLRF